MTIRNVNGLKQHISGREFDIAKSLFGLTDGTNSKGHNQGCPVCREGTNRFWFYPKNRTFHCNQCNRKGWDIIALSEKVFGESFTGAFDRIATAAGYVAGVSHIRQAVNEVKTAVQEGKPIAPSLDTFRLDADSPIFKATASHRPDIQFDDYQRAGAKLFRDGIAIPMFGIDGVRSGWVRYFQDGSKKNSLGSKSGIVGTDAIYNLRIAKQAKIVYKTAGVSDYLVLSGRIAALGLENDYYAFTNGSGENELPGKFDALLIPALTGQVVRVIQDNDSPGEAGALRWAEHFAEYAADVRIVGLPPVIFDCDVKDLRDFFNTDGTAFEDLLF